MRGTRIGTQEYSSSPKVIIVVVPNTPPFKNAGRTQQHLATVEKTFSEDRFNMEINRRVGYLLSLKLCGKNHISLLFFMRKKQGNFKGCQHPAESNQLIRAGENVTKAIWYDK